jgi:5-methylcytosine-specific restriction endonuclease McrA
MANAMAKEMKTCTKCGEVKPLEEFATRKDKYLNICKACESERVLSYYRKFGEYYYRSRYRGILRKAEEAGVKHDLTFKEFQGVFSADDPNTKICAYCGKTEAEEIDDIGTGLSIDHIVPMSYGGYNTLFNITAACRSCNSSKSNRHVLDFYNRSEKFTEERLNALIEHMAETAGQSTDFIREWLEMTYKWELEMERRVQILKKVL